MDKMSQDLVEARTTIARLDGKYQALKASSRAEILQLRSEIKDLKTEHSQSASLAEVMNDLKEQVNRLSVGVAINNISNDNHNLRIGLFELEKKQRAQQDEIDMYDELNREADKVMDLQRIEINNLETELDAAEENNEYLTQVHEEKVRQVAELEKKNDKLQRNLEEEEKVVQHLQDTHSSEVKMYEREIQTLKRLLARNDANNTLLEIIGHELQDYIEEAQLRCCGGSAWAFNHPFSRE